MKYWPEKNTDCPLPYMIVSWWHRRASTHWRHKLSALEHRGGSDRYTARDTDLAEAEGSNHEYAAPRVRLYRWTCRAVSEKGRQPVWLCHRSLGWDNGRYQRGSIL